MSSLPGKLALASFKNTGIVLGRNNRCKSLCMHRLVHSRGNGPLRGRGKRPVMDNSSVSRLRCTNGVGTGMGVK